MLGMGHPTGQQAYVADLQRKVERRIAMKTWRCAYCGLPVSEIGAYVKLAANAFAHRSCHDARTCQEHESFLAEQASRKATDDAERQKEAAIAAWRAAKRCPKCGVPMLPERPAGLPAEFSSVGSTNGSTCTLCVRQEAGLRAAARGREALPPAPKTTSLYSAEELRDRGTPQKSADQELIRKAKEAGTPAIEIE